MKKEIVFLAFLYAVSFSQNSFTDSRDGKVYKTVKIGEQVWMVQNLNFEANESLCYDNNPDNCIKFGRLYDWATAMNIDTSYNNSGGNSLALLKDKSNARKNILWGGSDVKHQGICPAGWHLPSSEEWLVLANSVGDSITNSGGGVVIAKTEEISLTIANKSFDAGKKLKAKDGWKSNGNGTDNYGFSALPGGYGRPGQFYKIGDTGYWWSASESNALTTRSRRIIYNYVDMSRSTNNKADMLSVRCIQD